MKFFRATVAIVVFLVACMVGMGDLSAAILPTDSAAMAGFKGSQAFTAMVGPLSYAADVDYAVYAPGAFQTSTALGLPTDPSGGTQYVYAYQLFDTGTPNQRTIGELSLGYNGDQSPSNLGVISGSGFGLNPTSTAFVPASSPPYASATWTYSPELTSGQVGNILIFTSPNPPSFYNASVLGGGLVNQQVLPSPIPEPVTTLATAGLVMMAAFSRIRR